MRQVLVRHKIARLAVVPLAVALLLSGCGRPGTAATVDGQRITDAQLATLVSDAERLPPPEATGLPLDGTNPLVAIQILVYAPTLLEVAAENGGGVSDQSARDLLDATVEQGGGTTWEYSTELLQMIKFLLASQSVGQLPAATESVNERFAALDVDLNPRFGTWEDGGLTPAAWPWLIESAS